MKRLSSDSPDKEQELLFLKTFAAHLKRLRKEKNMTQQQIADFLLTDKANYARIEKGRRSPTLTTLKKIAEALQLEVSELVSF